MNGIIEYIRKLFGNGVINTIAVICTFIYNVLFPTSEYLYAAGAVLCIMILDLLTKWFALSRQSGGLRKALKTRAINSNAFGKGTFEKLIVYGILLLVCGLGYRLSPIEDVAVWFTQLVFTLIFLRDCLSILENLSDAGVQGLGVFKNALKHKIKVIEEENTNESISEGAGEEAGK